VCRCASAISCKIVRISPVNSLDCALTGGYYLGVEIGFQSYPITDSSGLASLSVSNPRRRNPAGALIHTTAGISSFAWLTGDSSTAGTPASSNELIGRGGEVAIICEDSRYPFHAGQSLVTINGRTYAGNAVSEILMGWELECLDTQAPTFQQIDSLADRICQRALQYAWRWPFVIYGHYGVAVPPGRKHDPISLDWGGFMGRLYVRARAMGIPGL